ncbi:MAG: RNA methyltransferase, partial [Cytophagaceae bacterium]
MGEWLERNRDAVLLHPEAAVHTVSDSELSSVSALQTPNQALLVVEMPVTGDQPPPDQWTIALETVQDPGNMGTIIRIADWFGIPNILCTPDCVDIYNPKVVQAAMGGHLRLNFFSGPLMPFLTNAKIPVLAATLSGQSMYEMEPVPQAVLLIGNESKGLSAAVAATATIQ